MVKERKIIHVRFFFHVNVFCLNYSLNVLSVVVKIEKKVVKSKKEKKVEPPQEEQRCI